MGGAAQIAGSQRLKLPSGRAAARDPGRRHPPSEGAGAPTSPTRLSRWLQQIVVGAAAFVPLVFSTTSSDSFRLPKMLVLRAAAVLVLGALVALLDRQEWSLVVPALARREVRLALLVVGWVAITAAHGARPMQARGAAITI